MLGMTSVLLHEPLQDSRWQTGGASETLHCVPFGGTVADYWAGQRSFGQDWLGRAWQETGIQCVLLQYLFCSVSQSVLERLLGSSGTPPTSKIEVLPETIILTFPLCLRND